MIIRQENKNDYEQIYELVKTAFLTAQVSNGKEQDLVNELRDSDNYIPELALVAEVDSGIIGHILLTKTFVVDGDDKYEGLYLAPVSVVLENRKQGVGSKLIEESFRIAKGMGYTSVFLVGDPLYYHRFGFKSLSSFGIKYKLPIPEKNAMGCELVPNALSGVKGIIDSF